MTAQRQAAREVAEQTAKAIDDAISGSVRDLRGGGPGLHRAVDDQLAPVARACATRSTRPCGRSRPPGRSSPRCSTAR